MKDFIALKEAAGEQAMKSGFNECEFRTVTGVYTPFSYSTGLIG